MTRQYQDDYLGDDGPKVDLEDLIANSVFEDPDTRIWISVQEGQEPTGQWEALCQSEDDSERFYGTREDAIIWARAKPATRRHIWTGQDYADLDASPSDAPPPPPSGPTVQVHGPNHDGRWVAVWFHRGEVKQFWGDRQAVKEWALAQPATRRRMADGDTWQALTD